MSAPTAGAIYKLQQPSFQTINLTLHKWFEEAVKNRNWLNVTEYLLLIGTGVGSLAAVASQQIVFTAAPMSVLFLLNLVNRRRLEEATQENTAISVSQLDQKLTSDLTSLQQQVQVLPNFLDLASLRKAVTSKSEETANGLIQDITQLKREIAKPDWRLLPQEVRQLQDQYASLAESVTSVTTYLNRLSPNSRVDGLEMTIAQMKNEVSQLRGTIQTLGDDQRVNNVRQLQDQINHLNRRLNNLPTPFDATSLKQDVDALVKMMGEMASRRELSRLMSQIEQLTQQNQSVEQSVTPLKVAIAILKKQLDTIASRQNLKERAEPLDAVLQPEPPVVESLRATIAALEQRLEQLPNAADLSHLRVDMQGLVSSHVGQLQQQLASVQQVTQSLDHQQKTLRDWVNRLPHMLDSTALESQVKYLAARIEWAEGNGLDVQSQVEAAVKSQLEEMTQQLQASFPVPESELVFDITARSQADPVSGFGRSIVEQSLEKAQARLIVVYPYPTPETLNAESIQAFKRFLDRNGCLDVGWGHLGDVSKGRLPRSIDRRRAIDSTSKGFLYDTLQQLTQLKKQYPDQFRFKVLGTDENFLVCDRSYAILGAQSVSTASAVFPQAAVGLRSTAATVIQGLVERFDNPTLDAEDIAAYLSRAATRYDLGDRPGALADYTEVLQINPADDVAYNNRGLVRYDSGDRSGAIADFNLAIQHNPENLIAYCNRGFVRSELGDKLGAIEDYTDAIRIDPDYSVAYFYRGLARTRLQNKLGAIEDYTEVIRLNSQDATAYFYRGLACVKIGQRLDAIKDMRRAAHLFSEQGDTANYQQTLSTIKKLHKNLVTVGAATLVSNGI